MDKIVIEIYTQSSDIQFIELDSHVITNFLHSYQMSLHLPRKWYSLGIL